MLPTIQTCSGGYFDFLKPDSTELSITDVAHALSNICRFGGHTREFYSVAQHSVLVSRICPPHLRLHGLMHDAPESVLGDIPSPLKQLLPDYKTIEKNVERAILSSFAIDPDADWHTEVKKADLILLATEQRDLMGYDTETDEEWSAIRNIKRLDFEIKPLSPRGAEKLFLDEYVLLTMEHK